MALPKELNNCKPHSPLQIRQRESFCQGCRLSQACCISSKPPSSRVTSTTCFCGESYGPLGSRDRTQSRNRRSSRGPVSIIWLVSVSWLRQSSMLVLAGRAHHVTDFASRGIILNHVTSLPDLSIFPSLLILTFSRQSLLRTSLGDPPPPQI